MRFEKSAKVFKTEKGACNSRYFFQQTCKLRMLIVSTESKMASTEEVLVWTPELEVSLFHSMKGHKPVGKIFY